MNSSKLSLRLKGRKFRVKGTGVIQLLGGKWGVGFGIVG